MRICPLLLLLTGMTSTTAAQQFAAEMPPVMQWFGVLNVTHGDTDGDRDRDLYLQIWSTTMRWSALLHNDGTGVFTDLGNGLVQIGEQTSAFVDFDGDGDDDLFVSLVGHGQLLRRDPVGWTDVSALLPPSPAWHEMIVGDLDGDGDLDLAGVGNVLNGGRNQVLRNDGPLGFTAIDPFPGTNGRIRAADIDGDGDLDVLLGPDQLSSGMPVLLRNDGAMAFTGIGASWLAAALPLVNTFEFGDVDGDGDPDLVIGSTAGGDLLLRNTGSSFVAVPGALPPNAGTTFSPRFADVDEDGDLDLWRGETTNSVASTTLALNDGTGNFTAAGARLPGSAVATIRLTADLDGDGDIDAVTGGAGGARILWNRHRHVSSPAAPQLGTAWTVELWSQPGYGSTVRAGMIAIGIARLPQRLRLPPFGTLWLDLGFQVLLAPVQFLPGAGAATIVLPIPATPALAGLDLHLQGLVEDAPGVPRLTSARSVTIQ